MAGGRRVLLEHRGLGDQGWIDRQAVEPEGGIRRIDGVQIGHPRQDTNSAAGRLPGGDRTICVRLEQIRAWRPAARLRRRHAEVRT